MMKLNKQLISFVCITAVFLCVPLSVPDVQAKAKPGALQVSVVSAPKSPVKTVQGRIFVDAPPQSVWQILTDYPAWVNRVPGYEKSRILESLAAEKLLDVTMKVNPWLPAYRYQVRASERKSAYRLTFQRVSGDFEQLSAVYQLLPQDNGQQTVLSYTLSIDAGVPMPGIPTILKANTEKSLSAIKRHSELEAARSAIGHR